MKKRFRKTLSAAIAAVLCLGLASALPGPMVSAANGLGTYEAEDLEGADLWTSIYETQIPSYSGDGFAYLTASPITLEIEVAEEGMYQVDVRAVQVLSEDGRMQTISINGVDYTYNMPYITEWTDLNFGVFRMKEGVNEITLKPIYGYAAYDTITVSKAELPKVTGTDTLSDPNATPEAKALMKYLNSVYGDYILSGQQEIYGGGHGVQTSIRYDESADKCVDNDGKEYTIDPDSYDTYFEGETEHKFPWHCMDETGFVYTYDTQNRSYAYNDYFQEFRYLYDLTGEYPAIRGFDFNCHNPGFGWEDGVTDRMIDWATNYNGICTASWHVTVPTSMDAIEVDADGNMFTYDEEGEVVPISNDWQKYTYGIDTDFVTANVLVEGTKEYVFFQEAMKMLAAEIGKLQDAGVPLLFRPLHEAEGNPGKNADGSGSWFWWSKEGAEVYHQVWKLLYTTLTEEYGLHNIIWEQNLYAWSDESALWYTGDDWVDIVGFDKYNTQYNRHDGNTTGPNEDAESKIFWSLVDYVDNQKMVAMPENDSIPGLDNLIIEQAKWLYFCTWYDGESGAPQFISGPEYQNAETVKELFQSDYCITLSELPANLYAWDGTSEPATKPTETTPDETTDETDADTTGTETAPPDSVWGDADGNGVLDLIDVVALNKYLLIGEELPEQGKAMADVNQDGKLNTADSLNILKCVVKLITLPVGSDE